LDGKISPIKKNSQKILMELLKEIEEINSNDFSFVNRITLNASKGLKSMPYEALSTSNTFGYTCYAIEKGFLIFQNKDMRENYDMDEETRKNTIIKHINKVELDETPKFIKFSKNEKILSIGQTNE
jgi:hypothetical protein